MTTTTVVLLFNSLSENRPLIVYDALGNIRTEKRLNADDSIAESISYEYDNQSQLTQAHSSVTGTWSYQYDTYGNLRGTTHGNDTLNYTYGDANWIDLLTGVSGTKNGVSFSGSYVYDGAGNPTSFYNVGDRSTWTMSWKNGRELATAMNGTHTVSYDYDGNGLRTWKLVDGVRHDYIYASGQLLRETFTQGGTGYTLDFLYDQNGRPYMLYLTTTVSGVPTSAPFYYVLNLQGDVIHLVRTNGVPAASYTYDPYGNVLSATGVYANVNPLRYRGYYYDTETGFYYLQSRYYDPALGRFINADSYASTGQGFLGYNMFAYCGNNPIGRSDESGLLPTFSILVPDTYQRRVVAEDSEEYYETVSGHLKKNGQKINLPFNTTRVTVTKEETTVCKASDEIKEVTWYVRMTVKQQVYEFADSLPPEYRQIPKVAFTVANCTCIILQHVLPDRPAGKFDTYKIYAYHNEEHENHMYNNTIVTESVPVVAVTTYHISQETGIVYYGGSTVLSLGIPG